MTKFDKRDVERKASCEKLQEVTELGQTLGHWTISKAVMPDDSGIWRHVHVKTSQGYSFFMSAGNWGHESKIHICLDSVPNPNYGQGITARTVGGDTAPDAYISSSKSADQIIKDALRRVINNPDAIAIAQKMIDYANKLADSTSRLAQQAEFLKPLGFVFPSELGKSSYFVTARHPKLSNVKVYDNGRVIFEAGTTSEHIADILAILAKGE